MAHQSEHISSRQQALKSPVTLDLPLSFSMLWRISCDRSHGAMKGVDLAPSHTAKVDSWLQKTVQTNKKPPTSICKRSFTSPAGPVPQSTLQHVLLPLCLPIQTKGENT